MKKDALILALITLVAGLLLGGAYELTKDAREKQAEITKNKAYRAVLENSDDFTFEDISFDEIKGIDEKIVTIDGMVEAKDEDGNVAGYVINVTSKEGYGGDISFSVGITVEGVVSGISYLSISETAGLGMKAKEDNFIKQYVDGKGMFVVGDNIDAISGATITSKAVTEGVNAAIKAYETYTYVEETSLMETSAENETTGENETTMENETETGGEASNE